MSKGSNIKTAVVAITALISVIILAVSVFTIAGKAGKAEKNAADAEAAVAAYATALAESNERVNEISMTEPVTVELPAAVDHGSEALLYADFTSEDAAVRSALSALKQDDPDLIKNYRIKVDLDRMESVKTGGADSKRVRFSGTFQKMTKRNDALIRVISDGGSFKGRILIGGLKFNDTEIPDFGALTEEELKLSHGSALRGISLVKDGQESLIACDVEYEGKDEDERITVEIPLKELDSSTFTDVYYDLYFEGESDGFQFETGCDFTGQKEASENLDRINSAFAVFRSKVSAGQDENEARQEVTAAIDDMRSDLSRYSENDPLVITIYQSLDRKQAIIDGNDPDSLEAAEEPADTGEGADKGKEDKKSTENKGVVPQSTYTPSAGSGDGNGISLVLPVIFTLLSLFMIVILSVMHFSLVKKEEDREIVRRAREDKDRLRDEENLGLRKRLMEVEERSSAIKKKISGVQGKGTVAVDTSALSAVIERIEEKLSSVSGNIAAIATDNSVGEDSRAAKTALRNAGKVLNDLSVSAEDLNSNIMEISRQLEETSESVKDINKAATIISDVASETNLLSLNASIEAARAGEAGRGFAVVAGEISKLAEQTEKSVQEISDTVDKLNSDFEKTGKLMQSLNRFADEQSESLSNTRQSFEEAETLANRENGSEISAVRDSIYSDTGELKALVKELKREADVLNTSLYSDRFGDLLDEISRDI